MGWFWGKTPDAAPSTTTVDAPPAILTPSSQEQQQQLSLRTSTPPAKPNAVPSDPTDSQIARFLSIAENPPTTDASSSPSADAAYNPLESPADSQLPTTMSCRQAFDLATGCQSMVGQMRHVYRYGEFRSCATHWADFWFCMRTRGGGGDGSNNTVGEALVREHYRQREHDKYHAQDKRSSEDVWEAREKKVPHDAFFNEPINPPVTDHDEWRRAEMERRRRIREKVEQDERTR